ncbi:hypothetical protein EDB89DRAFT_2082580 [Lactarius sanguifluus]|nr:hypothetical protein EDB89DRAFT_2082580 [Lactarius sanguifluus]
MPLDHIIKIYKSNTKGHKKPEGQPAVIPTCNKHTGIIQDNQRDSGGRVIRLKGYPTTSHFELSTDPSLRAHTQATHSPAPVSGHASHVTASPPALCPPAATLWTSPLRRHQLNTPDSDAATLIPPPTFTPPSRHPPPTAPTHQRHDINNPQVPQPATATSTTTITTATAYHPRQQRLRRIDPSAIYRPRPPASSTPPPPDSTRRATAATPLPSLSHPHQPPSRPTALARPRPTAIDAAASAPTPHATSPPPSPSHPTNPVPPNCHQRHRLSPDSTRHATAATSLRSLSHPTNPVPPNRPGLTSS